MTAVVQTVYDLTRQAPGEVSLRLFSQAVEQISSTVMITDVNGTILYVNGKFCEVTGYAREEVLGANPRLLKSGFQPDSLYQELWDAISRGREWRGEMQNKRKDGTIYWESASISPMVDDAGVITHYLAVKEDITATRAATRQLHQKQAEMVLKHEQLRLLFSQVEKGKKEWEQTLDCIDDMVLLVDSGGKIRRCNRSFAQLTETPAERLLYRDWRELLGSVGLDPNAVAGGSGEMLQAATQRWFALRTYPYGEGEGEVITLHDLTDIKRVSQELATAYQELKTTHSQLLQQEKMASIGQLAAGVAHEINNPMGFISSNLSTMEKYLERLEGFLQQQSQLLARCASPEEEGEIREARRRYKVDYILEDARSLLQESKDGAERVRTIVANLKSFSHVDEAASKYVDLNECLDSTISIAWNELKYKTTLKKEYGELPPVRCLPQQLNQVFLNILVNAAHAIEKQGEIAVRSWHHGDRVSIAISDTGGGIPETIRHRIFEPFFTTKEVGKGTGLGLSISYDIIAKHNGTIKVESEVGVGTTFTITLPVEGEEP